MLIHLVDASSPQLDSQVNAVEKILDQLNLSKIPRLLVLNKSDLLTEDEIANLRQTSSAVVISALHPETLEAMIDRVGNVLSKSEVANEHSIRPNATLTTQDSDNVGRIV